MTIMTSYFRIRDEVINSFFKISQDFYDDGDHDDDDDDHDHDQDDDDHDHDDDKKRRRRRRMA